MPAKQIEVDKKVNTWDSIDLKVLSGLCFFTILLYANTFGHGFVLDDPLAIALNKNVTSGFGGIWDIIAGSYRENNFGGQLYRPVSLIQFAMEWQLSPNNPMIHHVSNVVWYAWTVCLVYWVVKAWLPSSHWTLPVAIAALFAVHPLHTEVVANIKSRDEIMSMFFLLVAFITWHKFQTKKTYSWVLYTVIAYFFSLISKESSVTMFPIFGMLAYWIYSDEWKMAVKKGLLLAIPVLLLFIIRLIKFGGQPTPDVSIMDNPIVGADGFAQHLATSFVILLKYFKLLFFPTPLSSDYSYTVIPLADFSNLGVWVSVLLHFFLLAYAINTSRQKDILALFVWGYLLALSLFSQLPLTIGTMFGERLAFLASFWWAAGVIIAISKITPSKVKYQPAVFIVALLCIGFATKTFVRNAAWKNNLTLFTTDVATYPNSVRLNNAAAEIVLETADLPENASRKNELLNAAEGYCNKIMSIRPVPTAYLILGNIRLKQGKYEDALHYYDQVNDLKSIVDINKAIALREMGRNAGQKENNIAKSQSILRQSLQLNDKDAESWFLLGVSYGVSGNHTQAAEYFVKAYQLNPLPAYAQNAATAYQSMGDQDKALQFQNLAK